MTKVDTTGWRPAIVNKCEHFPILEGTLGVISDPFECVQDGEMWVLFVCPKCVDPTPIMVEQQDTTVVSPSVARLLDRYVSNGILPQYKIDEH